MMLAQLKWKPLDKLYMLWTICLIAHRREHQQSVSKAAIIRDFGEDIYFIFDTYCIAAIRQRHLNPETMQLTPRGLAASSNWQRISDEIRTF